MQTIQTKYDADFVRRFFDEFAPSYHLTGRLSFGLDDIVRSRAINSISLTGNKVCDMMSGSGQNWKFIRRNNPLAQITGVDFSAEMNSIAAADKQVHILQQCACHSTLSNNSMDALVCSFGLKTLSQQQQFDFCLEALRVLKTGGEFVMIEFSRPQKGIAYFLYYCYFYLLLPLLLFIGGRRFRQHSLLKAYVDDFGNVDHLYNFLLPQCTQIVRLRFLFGLVTGIKGVK